MLSKMPWYIKSHTAYNLYKGHKTCCLRCSGTSNGTINYPVCTAPAAAAEKFIKKPDWLERKEVCPVLTKTVCDILKLR